VDDGLMRNGNIVAYVYRCFLVSAMYDGAILDVYCISYFNIVNVTPDHRIEPNTAIVTHGNFTNYGGIICQEAVFAKNRREAAYGFY